MPATDADSPKAASAEISCGSGDGRIQIHKRNFEFGWRGRVGSSLHFLNRDRINFKRRWFDLSGGRWSGRRRSGYRRSGGFGRDDRHTHLRICFVRPGARSRSGFRGWRAGSWRDHRRRRGQFTFADASDFRISSAKFSKTVGVYMIVALAMNLFELRRQFRGAAIVTSAQMQIEQPFERRGMPRRALQHIFKQVRGFLRQAVTRKQVDVGECLGDIALSIFVERFFDNGRSNHRRQIYRGFIDRFRDCGYDWARSRRSRRGCVPIGRDRNGCATAACPKLIQPLNQPLVILISIDEFNEQFFGSRIIFL